MPKIEKRVKFNFRPDKVRLRTEDDQEVTTYDANGNPAPPVIESDGTIVFYVDEGTYDVEAKEPGYQSFETKRVTAATPRPDVDPKVAAYINAAIGEIPPPAPGAFKPNADGTAIIPVDNSDSWIVGSDRMGQDTTDATKNYRAFFNKVKGAFRAGIVQGAEWDDVNVGFVSRATGVNTTASGHSSQAEGNTTRASGDSSHAEGNHSVASHDAAHAEGQGTTASGQFSHAEGVAGIARGQASHAEGNTTTASGMNSHAEGSNTKANADHSHAEGFGSITALAATGAHAEGSSTANGAYSHAEGQGSVANGDRAHAEGQSTTATGAYSHAEGSTTYAGGQESHAEGYYTQAYGTRSHTEGDRTQAGGTGAHAEGSMSSAGGYVAHAEGDSTYATGDVSHASGRSSMARRYAERAHSAGGIAGTGDAQQAEMVLRRTTTDATPGVLTAWAGTVNLTGANTTVLTLPASRTFKVKIDVVARRSDVAGEHAGWSFEGLIARDATGNAYFVGTLEGKAWGTAAAVAWDLTPSINTVDATNNYLALTATGDAAKTVRWVASINWVEVG